MTERASFPVDPESVAAARQFVLDALGEVPTEVRESVELMVSELATNAVVHAGSPFDITVGGSPDLVRVEVVDHGAGTPAVHAPLNSEPHGRGLQIIRALSDAWGIEGLPGRPGKVVWFTVRSRREIPTDDDGSSSEVSLGGAHVVNPAGSPTRKSWQHQAEHTGNPGRSVAA